MSTCVWPHKQKLRLSARANEKKVSFQGDFCYILQRSSLSSRGKIASVSAVFVWPREENFQRQGAAFRAKPENKQTAQKFSWCG